LFGGNDSFGESVAVLGTTLVVVAFLSVRSMREGSGRSIGGGALFGPERAVGLAAGAIGLMLLLASVMGPSALATPWVRGIALVFVGLVLGAGLAPLLPLTAQVDGPDHRLIVGSTCGLALWVMVWYVALWAGLYSAAWATSVTFAMPAAGWLLWRREAPRGQERRGARRIEA
jgi:hypothetical protein